MGQYRTFLLSGNRKLSQLIGISDRVFRQSSSSLERQSADRISETMNNRTFKLLFRSQPNPTRNKKQKICKHQKLQNQKRLCLVFTRDLKKKNKKERSSLSYAAKTKSPFPNSWNFKDNWVSVFHYNIEEMANTETNHYFPNILISKQRYKILKMVEIFSLFLSFL